MTWSGTCATGRRQSPVEIGQADVDFEVLEKLHFNNYIKSGPIKLLNNGQTRMMS
jgi:carbonic anhydrase